MLYFYYQDGHERARAVASIAERCRRLDAPFVVLGPEAACETMRDTLSRLEPTARPCPTFRTLLFGQKGNNGERSWVEAIEVIRLALGSSGPTVAWVEAPVTQSGITSNELCAYHDALEILAAGRNLTRVISAFGLAHISERALVSLLKGSTTLMSAETVLPHCPSWLIARTPADSTPAHLLALFQAEKRAALRDLVAGVSHELGNPLSIISSSLQYLHQRLAAANDPASDFTMTALENIERVQDLLGRMLGCAAIKKHRFAQIDLKEAVSEVLEFTSAECARRCITVDVSFDLSLSPVWADPCGLKQILINLVKNALDALLQSGDTLRLSTKLRPEDRLAVVEVEDNGPPIADDVLPNLFRPFHTTKDGGAGLGLYLSRQIAMDHGGDLEAANLPHGVRFSLRLPLDRRRF